MGNEDSLENLRKTILLSTALNERSLSELQKLFTLNLMQENDFFLRSGEYPVHFAFVHQGVIKSFVTDQKGREIIRGFFVPGMFALPLPAFIYRKPSFLSFQAVTPCTILIAKYSDIQALAQNDHSIHLLVRLLIEKEWIVNRELHDAGLYVYNSQTRYRLFREKYRTFIDQIPDRLVGSFLNIPLNTLERIRKESARQ